MTVSTLSPKNQTTLNAKHLRELNLRPDVKLKQWVESGRIILEPLGTVSTAFGALKPKRKFTSIAEETKEMERAVGRQVARGK
jgi:hypothetical protein